MWYKVNELFSDSLNKTQIGQSLGLHRQTVAKYLSMTEEEFISIWNDPKERKKVRISWKWF